MNSAAVVLGHSRMLRDAYEFAARAHAGQRQESGPSPYIEHPVAVAGILQRAGCGDEVIAAGLLHDTLERSDVKLDELERRFGRRVSVLVAAMTEPEHATDFRIRKAAHRSQIAEAGADAAAIFAADKIATVQKLRRVVSDQGEEAVRRRLSTPLELKVEHYREALGMLDGLALPRSLIRALREELDGLDITRSPALEPQAR